MRCLQYTTRRTADDLRASLRDEAAARVEGVGSEEALLALAEQLGTVIEPGVGMPGGAHDGRVYSVAVRNEGRGLVDEHGNVILSSTNQEFGPHTDGYNRPAPPRVVFLLRHDATLDETPAYVSDVRRWLPVLSSDVLATLHEPAFPSAMGPIPLLTETGRGTTVRFNGEEIARWEGTDPNPVIAERAQRGVTALTKVLRAHGEPVVIRRGDCLVIDNQRACHWRPALSADSKRVLKRVWVA